MKKLTLLILTLFISVFLIGQEIQGMKTITISTGSTNTLSLSSDVSLIYIYSDNETLSSSFSVNATGTPVEGNVFEFRYYGKTDLNGNTFSIFGTYLTQGQLGNAVFNKIIIYAHYFSGVWKVFIVESIDSQLWIKPNDIEALAITTTKITDKNVTLAKIEDITSGSIIVGNVSNIPTSVAVTGDIGINNAGLTSISNDVIVDANIKTTAEIGYSKLDLTGSVLNADLAGSVAWDKMVPLTVSKVPVIDASGEIVASSITATELGYAAGVTSPLQPQIDGKITSGLASGKIFIGSGAGAAVEQILTGDVTIATTGVTTIPAATVTGSQIAANTIIPANLEDELQKEIITCYLSFETGFQGTYKIKMSYTCELTNAHVNIIKALAGTDNASLNFQDNAGNNMTGGSLVTGNLPIILSSALGTVVNTAITGNNTLYDGNVLQLTTSKATAGGVIIVTLEFTRVLDDRL